MISSSRPLRIIQSSVTDDQIPPPLLLQQLRIPQMLLNILPGCLAAPEHFTLCEVSATHHDGSLLAVVAVELQQVFERKIADDVRVEDEERLVVDVQQLSSQRQRARCTQTRPALVLLIIFGPAATQTGTLHTMNSPVPRGSFS